MLDEKLAAIEASGADAVCACDSSCLMHIGGGLRRRGSKVRVVHLAEVLAS
jgi:L-lactate dehydrogenase complex protein LldE